ncbi:hypothetical protein [Actinoplanes sp. NBRC 101535]|uniref:hypothetical protein n=1 Tax=Actinoplanes sp. NBRC 101535 TaxID=3032196 RepID=UPI002552BBD2|nr:hypothetical protein [Actinoplanes sp. NBRC 101535]
MPLNSCCSIRYRTHPSSPPTIMSAAAGCGAAVYVSRRSFSWQAKWWLLGAWALLMVGGMLLTRTT